MALLGIDLGGTKLAVAVFSEQGGMLSREIIAIGDRKGAEVGRLIAEKVAAELNAWKMAGNGISSIGISVPGISHESTGTVWAPNIEGWENYPLLSEVKKAVSNIPVAIDSDRACYILGEVWKGNAGDCRNAIFLSVGTGIGAGIMINGEVLRGSGDIAGCTGWMALQRPFLDDYKECGCLEYYASGEGISRLALALIKKNGDYAGELKYLPVDCLKASDVFSAYDKGDQLAAMVIDGCVELWGMAVANLVSLLNPEKIIFGGGVFGPAIKLLPSIMAEAVKWAQPVGIRQVSLEPSALAGDAGVYGAGFLALKKLADNR